MDRTRVPSEEEVAAAKMAWEASKNQGASPTVQARAEGRYRQLRARLLGELI